jgi:aryl carrier-like protein
MVRPASEAEEKLAELCREVLELPAIGTTDSLFDLGADSLRLFQIVSRAAARGLPLTVTHLLRHRTISAICAALDRDQPAQSAAPRLVRANRESRSVSRDAVSR